MIYNVLKIIIQIKLRQSQSKFYHGIHWLGPRFTFVRKTLPWYTYRETAPLLFIPKM